jgi:hypothetical protein
MNIEQTISELRRLGRFCLDQAEQAGTPDGRAALLKMAMSYRDAAERLLNSGRDVAAG